MATKIVTVNDLVKISEGHVKDIIALEPVEKELPNPAYDRVYNPYATKTITLPSPSIFVDTQNLRQNQVNLTVYDKDSHRIVFTVSPDAKFKILVGKAKQELINPHKEKIKKDLKQFITSTCKTRQIGSDPEIFLENDKGQIIPAWAFLPSKESKKLRSGMYHPNGVDNYKGDKAIYWDGWQAEFETAPNTCNEAHTDSIYLGLYTLYREALKFDPTAKLSLRNVIEVPLDVLASTDPQFVEFGCKPSYNVYGLSTPNLVGKDIIYRSAGGHLHFGIGKQPDSMVEEIVKALDAIVGVAGVSLAAKIDNPIRRNYYGLAGEFRLPHYGVSKYSLATDGLEYRTLSNFWLCHPCIENLVVDLSRNVIAFAMDNYRKFWKVRDSTVIEVINSCDVKGARRILKRNEDVLKTLLFLSYGDARVVNKAYDTILHGVEHIVADPSDIVKNWNLNSRWDWGCASLGKKWRSAALSGTKV